MGAADREHVILYNLATKATVVVGVVTFYLALVLIAFGSSYALIAPTPFAQELGHPIGRGDHLQPAFLTSGVVTLARALGSLTESDSAVREAMYRDKPDARIEEDNAADREERARLRSVG